MDYYYYISACNAVQLSDRVIATANPFEKAAVNGFNTNGILIGGIVQTTRPHISLNAHEYTYLVTVSVWTVIYTCLRKLTAVSY